MVARFDLECSLYNIIYSQTWKQNARPFLKDFSRASLRIRSLKNVFPKRARVLEGCDFGILTFPIVKRKVHF